MWFWMKGIWLRSLSVNCKEAKKKSSKNTFLSAVQTRWNHLTLTKEQYKKRTCEEKKNEYQKVSSKTKFLPEINMPNHWEI